MYFPYLRGRQYELLALKELVNKNLISKSIVPVVELIKNTSTLNSTLKTFNDKNMSLALIINPSVGELTKNCNHISSFNDWFKPENSIIPAVLLSGTSYTAIVELENSSITNNDILAVLNSRDYIKDYKSIFDRETPKYTLCLDDRAFRREVKNKKVLLEDKFNKLSKNADYYGDEFFSEDHLYFKDEGYIGFSDYSIVGSDYSDTGFAPYAVAIHIVYFDYENILRVAHFVSDSNNDISDVAGKFYEAVVKLRDWFNKGQEKQRTEALSILLNHADNGYYPGLPTIKKLSIMHHLELMSKYLDGGFNR